ncbi:hypothetical protein [Sphaerisporangium corydalis]|uniref:Uncharacterized protein n=1 Tax=Sphaerisporangium corydalis TaxID=1441875 RepID=A0ABV9EGU3_9ACTN|nr:hypothetical protein [Sphaerisporangium corydalis]
MVTRTNDSKIDPAALIAIPISISLATLSEDGGWDTSTTIIGTLLLLTIGGFLRFERPTHWLTALLRAAATGAVIGASALLIAAFPVQQQLGWELCPDVRDATRMADCLASKATQLLYPWWIGSGLSFTLGYMIIWYRKSRKPVLVNNSTEQHLLEINEKQPKRLRPRTAKPTSALAHATELIGWRHIICLALIFLITKRRKR